MEELLECKLCPQNCKVNRLNKQVGRCKAGEKIKIALADLHFFEEPCISGKSGSGTIFFTGCNMSCKYCQNYKISQNLTGREIEIEELAEEFLKLQQRGANNINLVTGFMYVPHIIKALKIAKEKGLRIPIVYNSSGYEKVESLKAAEGLIDIYLPDFKYIDSERAGRYSKVSDYPEVAMAALDEMVRQKPECKFDDSGILKSGVIVRHLLLPQGLSESKKVIKYLHQKYGDTIFISIMSQYTPFGDLGDYPELSQKVKFSDYEKLIDYAVKIGVSNAFIQEGEAASESFIPDFSGQGV